MAVELVVGVDLGTTTLKAGLFDQDGTSLGFGEVAYPIDRPSREWAEQDSSRWLDGLAAVLTGLEAQASGRKAAAVGVCSQVNTHVFVGENREALRPAIVWQDQRCAATATRLNEWFAEFAPAKAGLVSFAASSLPARAMWIAREEPKVWGATRHILSPKDFVTQQLCLLDAPVTDPITPFDLVDDNGVYDEEIVGLVDGVRERLPQIERVDEVVGTVECDRFPLLEGAAAVTGTMDAWGSVYGSGVVDHGEAMEVAGTSEILALRSRERHRTPGVVSFFPMDGLYLHAGPTQAGGAVSAWLASVTSRTVSETAASAASAAAGSENLLFMPHLLGERAPLWDSEMRGAFIGLSSEHDFHHLSRAVLEGVAYSARHLLEALQEAGAVRPEVIRASGGGSVSDLWCQIKANVFDLPVVRLQVRHSGCLGAALMAASGAQLIPELREAARNNIRIDRVFEPQPGREIYDELYGLYRGLHEVLRPTHTALARLREEPVAPTRLLPSS